MKLVPGAIVAEKFEVLYPLGAGGMGVVMAARNLRTGGELALKCIHPSASHAHAERLRREAQAAARVRHANVVTVFDVVEDDGHIILVMELLPGQTLEQRLQQAPLSLELLLVLLRDAMYGVAAAHDRDVIHRDIKPANIFLLSDTHAQRPAVKVLDFGVSKVAGPQSGPMTQTGVLLGTLCYMSPEQLTGSRDVDFRTDIYSFGVILYEAVTGRLPFIGTPAAVISRSLTSFPPPPNTLNEDIPTELNDLILRAMHPNLEERHPTMTALIGDVDALLGDTDVRERSSFLVAHPPMMRALAAKLPAPMPEPRSERSTQPHGVHVTQTVASVSPTAGADTALAPIQGPTPAEPPPPVVEPRSDTPTPVSVPIAAYSPAPTSAAIDDDSRWVDPASDQEDTGPVPRISHAELPWLRPLAGALLGLSLIYFGWSLWSRLAHDGDNPQTTETGAGEAKDGAGEEVITDMRAAQDPTAAPTGASIAEQTRQAVTPTQVPMVTAESASPAPRLNAIKSKATDTPTLPSKPAPPFAALPPPIATHPKPAKTEPPQPPKAQPASADGDEYWGF